MWGKNGKSIGDGITMDNGRDLSSQPQRGNKTGTEIDWFKELNERKIRGELHRLVTGCEHAGGKMKERVSKCEL